MTPPSRPAWIAPLAATILIQTTLSYFTRLIPTLAPVVTAAAGLAPGAIGYLSAAGTAGSMLFLASGNPLIARLEPIRALQYGLGVAAIGVLLLLTPSVALLFAASFLAGVGYGPSAPAGSDVLLRLSPVRHRNLIFSLKQAGVPLSGVLAGLTLPVLYTTIGLRPTIWLVALIPAATIVIAQPVRSRVDAGRNPLQSTAISLLLSPANLVAPFRMIAASALLRRLTLAGAFLACGQGSLFAFLVTFLDEEADIGLVASGGIFALTQLTGIPGRVALGWLADRTGSGLPLLRLLCFASAATTTGFGLVTPQWPFLALAFLAGIAGVTVSSWNGVQLAEIAREAPKGRVTETTSGATLVIFVGYVVGPALFASLLKATGSYALPFFATAALSLSGVIALPRARAARS